MYIRAEVCVGNLLTFVVKEAKVGAALGFHDLLTIGDLMEINFLMGWLPKLRKSEARVTT